MTRAQQSAVDAASCVVRPHRRAASEKPSRAGEAKSENNTPFTSPALSAMGSPKLNGEKMGGLALPDVVRELLKDPSILLWDAREQVYEVLDGDLFEARFNELRKVRNKVKAAGTERPFSRMYNFFVLEHGDKWARTGTRFRPRNATGHPNAELLASIRAPEAATKKSAASPAVRARPSPSPSPKVAPSGYAQVPSAIDLGPKASPRVSAAADGSLGKRGGSATPRAGPAKRAKSHTPQPSPRLAPKAHGAPLAAQSKTLSAMRPPAPAAQAGYAPGDVRHPLSMLNSVISGPKAPHALPRAADARHERHSEPRLDPRYAHAAQHALNAQGYEERASARRLHVAPHGHAGARVAAFLPDFALPQRHAALDYSQQHHARDLHRMRLQPEERYDHYAPPPRGYPAAGGRAVEAPRHEQAWHEEQATELYDEGYPAHHAPLHHGEGYPAHHAPLHHGALGGMLRARLPHEHAVFAGSAPAHAYAGGYTPRAEEAGDADLSDGLSSGQPSPEGMMLAGDFAGSPLELEEMAALSGHDAGLADLLYDSRAPGKGLGEAEGGLLFDDHDSIWNSIDAIGAGW